MRYLGGKSKLGKKIAQVLEGLREEGQTYFEPFMGGAWVMQEMKGFRIGRDANLSLMTMFQQLQNGWIPPEEVSEEDYKNTKGKPTGNAFQAFVQIGCSFGGKWGGGYARSPGRNYAKNAKNSLLKKMRNLRGVVFQYGDYKDTSPSGMLIYCDPPYHGTTKFDGVDSFDHEEFWEVMRKWSKENTVVISEYNAPEDFVVIAEFPTKTDMRTNKSNARIEKLFMHSSNIQSN